MQVVAATSGDMSTCEGGQQHGHGRSRSRVHPKELIPEKGDGHRGGRLPMGCHAHVQARLRPSRNPSKVLCRIESIHVELTSNCHVQLQSMRKKRSEAAVAKAFRCTMQVATTGRQSDRRLQAGEYARRPAS